MQTAKDFSTISFNSPAFLENKLKQLQKIHIISKWYFIVHTAEADEKKDHIHLFITPSKRINTDSFLNEFIEIDTNNPNKPRKCLTAHPSKFPEWYLYSIHDPVYLQEKGLARAYYYTEENFVCSDDDEFFRDVRSINRLEMSPFQKVFAAVMQGESFTDLLFRGGIPIQQIGSYEKAWAYCTEYKQRLVGNNE